MAKLLRSLSQIPTIPLLLGWGFLTISTFSCSSGDDMQDNGLALMQQIVQPLKDNIKKNKELWGYGENDIAGDLKNYNDYTQKIKEHTKQIKTHPEDTQSYLNLVEAIELQEAYNPQADDKSKKRAYRTIIDWLDIAIKKESGNKELYRKRAEAYYEIQQYQKSITDYSHVLAIDSLDKSAILWRGRAHEKMGLKKEAQRDFDAYVHIESGGTAEQYHSRGLFYYTRGNFELAEQALSKSIELDPNYEPSYFFRAEIYFVQNRYDDSNADYKKSLELESYLTGFILGRMGMNYYYQGNYKMAEEVLEKGLKQDPSLDAVAWWYLSRQKQDKSSKAALEHITQHFGAENLGGAALHFFLDKISVDELLKKKYSSNISTMDYSISMALYYVGQHYLMRGDTAKAKTTFEQSIQEGEEWYFPGRLFSEKELARLK